MEVSDYTGLIASQHADKPKYMAMVGAVSQAFVDVQNAVSLFPTEFDLDDAVGAQLDVIGLWVGIGRFVNTPLAGVYFSFDTDGLGFDQGVWKGPFDPDSGVTRLDDGTYRLLIKAKIGANTWDGTLEGSAAILQALFGPETKIFIQDNGDMSITIGISGQLPSAIFLALLSGGYIPIKPEGVRVAFYVVSSSSGSPIFGFDVGNGFISGFDQGAWATPA